MNIKIDHIALYCIDIEAMKPFFIKHFGCQPNDMYHNPRTGLKTYILTFPEGSTRLEIMSHPNVNETSAGLYKAGYIHISIAVGSREDVVEKTNELSEAGYECISGPRVTGDGYFESSLIGPEGIILEITV